MANIQEQLTPYLERLQTELKICKETEARVKHAQDNLAEYSRTGSSQATGEQSRLATLQTARDNERARIHEIVKTVKDARSNRGSEWNAMNSAFRDRLESVLREAEHH